MSRLLILLAGCLTIAEAGVRGHAARDNEATQDKVDISPTLKPTSDKNFFGSEYPQDKRPAVDVLHFKHPYPAVQDSDDFDADYVKDENHDDGSWKAQTEYDRLRHKLAKEKAELAKALEAKRLAEKQLQQARDAKQKATKTTTQPPPVEEKQPKVVEPKPTEEPEVHPPTIKERHGKTEVEKIVEPKPTPGPVNIEGAQNDLEKKMATLQDCKKQLSEAREELKKVLSELEKYKDQQTKTQSVWDELLAREKALRIKQKALEEAVQKEYKEYMDAREAFMKQQALLSKLEDKLDAAAAKVKAIRDAEDPNGGVYNTKRGTAQLSSMPVFALLAFLLAQLA